MNEEVILEKLTNLETLFKSYGTANKDDHGRIESQVVKTNNRVSNLEKWRAYIVGAISVLTALVLPVSFLILSKMLDIWF